MVIRGGCVFLINEVPLYDLGSFVAPAVMHNFVTNRDTRRPKAKHAFEVYRANRGG